jgi:hypothetical protein
MNFYLLQAFNNLISVVAIIGLVRFRKISSVFHPFLILIWFGAINEIISAIIINLGYYNIFNYNIALLVEPGLLLWQLKNWNLFNTKNVFYFLLFLFIAGWLTENIIISKFYLGFNSYFRIVSSLIVALLCLSMLNKVIVRERKNLIRNSIFIICCGVLVAYTYAILTESFIVYRVSLNAVFRKNLYRIFLFINLFCNIIFGLAILWMPKKQAFTLQY